MGWTKVDHEGKVLYERDGVRVESVEQIQAIEAYERQQAEDRQHRMNVTRWEQLNQVDDDSDDIEPLPLWGQIVIVLIVLCIPLSSLIFG